MIDEPARRPGLWWRIGCATALFVYRLLYRVERRGRERIPARGPVVFVANHASHLDPPIVAFLAQHRGCGFLARGTLFRLKPFARLIGSFGAVPIDPRKGSAEPIRAAQRVLEAGGCIVMFPEGTRSRDGRTGAFKPGFLLLVRRTGATVVPVSITGAFEVWPAGRRFPRLRGRIIARAQEPVDAATITAGTPDDALESLRRTIEAGRLELREELRSATGGRYPASGPADTPYWDAPASG